MLRIRIFAALAAVGLLISPLPALAQASFQGLGDLPGGDFNSAAYAISADGSVVAGQSSSASGSGATYLIKARKRPHFSAGKLRSSMK